MTQTSHAETLAQGFASKWGCSIQIAALEKARERIETAAHTRRNYGNSSAAAALLSQAGELRRVTAQHMRQGRRTYAVQVAYQGREWGQVDILVKARSPEEALAIVKANPYGHEWGEVHIDETQTEALDVSEITLDDVS